MIEVRSDIMTWIFPAKDFFNLQLHKINRKAPGFAESVPAHRDHTSQDDYRVLAFQNWWRYFCICVLVSLHSALRASCDNEPRNKGLDKDQARNQV